MNAIISFSHELAADGATVLGRLGLDSRDPVAALVGYWVFGWHHRHHGDTSCPVLDKREEGHGGMDELGILAHGGGSGDGGGKTCDRAATVRSSTSGQST